MALGMQVTNRLQTQLHYQHLCFNDTSNSNKPKLHRQRRALCKSARNSVQDNSQAESAVKEWFPDIVAKVTLNGRVLAVGSSALVASLMASGVEDLLAVSTDTDITQQLPTPPTASTLGNDLGLRVWHGPLSSIPAYQGQFEAIFVDDLADGLRETLLAAALHLKPGGILAVVDNMGGAGKRRLSQEIYDLPLWVIRDAEVHSSVTLLKVPEGYAFSRAPIFVEEVVVSGFGRGSKQMGIPTANLRPDDLFSGPLDGLPLGVYFGWAQLQGAQGENGAVHKTVLNIGKRPSMEDGEQRTVELHILHSFGADFYGERMKMCMLGFIRPEIKFNGLPSLISRINADKGLAKTQLDLPLHAQHANDSFFS